MGSTDGLLDTLYAAPTSPELWSGVLDLCIDLVGAESGWVNELDRRDRSAGSGFVRRVDPKEQDRYFSYYARLDPFRCDSGDTRRIVGMCGDDWFVRKSDLVRSEFYNDFMVPIAVHSILILRMYADGDVTRSLHLNYNRKRDWTASSGWGDLQAIFPHLRRAAALSREMKRLALTNGALSQALDVTSSGVFLLDRRGKLCFETEAGAALLRRGDCLTARGGRVRAVRTDDAAQFDRMIQHATDATQPFRQGGSMHVSTAGRGLPMVVTVAPLGAVPQHDNEPAAVLTLRDPGATLKPSDRVLATAFGLTPAERRIATMLAAGSSPRQTASELGLSYNTVRNHLKQIYGKLDVNRQADLVSKLLRLGFIDAVPDPSG